MYCTDCQCVSRLLCVSGTFDAAIMNLHDLGKLLSARPPRQPEPSCVAQHRAGSGGLYRGTVLLLLFGMHWLLKVAMLVLTPRVALWVD